MMNDDDDFMLDVNDDDGILPILLILVCSLVILYIIN
jgi:hypothetical protein